MSSARWTILLSTLLPTVAWGASPLDRTQSQWDWSSKQSYRVECEGADSVRGDTVGRTHADVNFTVEGISAEWETRWFGVGSGEASSRFRPQFGRVFQGPDGVLEMSGYVGAVHPRVRWIPRGSSYFEGPLLTMEFARALDGHFIFCWGRRLEDVIGDSPPGTSSSPDRIDSRTKYGRIQASFPPATGLLSELSVDAGADDVCKQEPLRRMTGRADNIHAVRSVVHMYDIVWEGEHGHRWMAAAKVDSVETYTDGSTVGFHFAMRRSIKPADPAAPSRWLATIPVDRPLDLIGNHSGVEYKWSGSTVAPDVHEASFLAAARSTELSGDAAERPQWMLAKLVTPLAACATAGLLVYSARQIRPRTSHGASGLDAITRTHAAPPAK